MRRMLAVAVAAGLSAFGLALGSGPVSAGGSGVVVTPFDYTGALQQFRVPEGICSVTVEAWGAFGALDNAAFQAQLLSQTVGPGVASVAPALGGHAKSVVATEPGTTLWVSVGGAGQLGTVSVDASGPSASATGGAGGWPDGGQGGSAAATGTIEVAPTELGIAQEEVGIAEASAGGGGGGSSDVRQGGSSLTDRVVVAGGGGGAGAAINLGTNGSDVSVLAQEAPGGGGGGLEGEPGLFFANPGSVTAAGGGTQAHPGDAGTPNGFPGVSSTGGQGGKDVFEDLPSALGLGAAGGGGGGYFGGGGGGVFVSGQGEVNTQPSPPLVADVGGGGGGSGHGPDGTTFQTGVREGNGQVTITYDPATDACPGHLLVNKKVKGDPPDDADYTIRYSCVTDDQSPVVKQVVVHGAGTAVDEYFGDAPVTCTVTEPGSDDADKVKFSCSPSDGAVCEADNRVTFPSGVVSEATITVTNIFEEEEEPAPTPTAAVPVAVAVAPTFTG